MIICNFLYSVNLLYIHSVLSNLHSVNYIQSSYVYSVPSYLYLVNLYIFSLILHVFSLILYVFSPILYYMYSVSSYIFSLILFMFSQLICIHSHLICIQFRRSRPEVFCKKSVLRNFAKFLRTNTSGGCFCQFTFIFCEHVQGAVCHVENLIKIYSFLKQSEFMS